MRFALLNLFCLDHLEADVFFINLALDLTAFGGKMDIEEIQYSWAN